MQWTHFSLFPFISSLAACFFSSLSLSLATSTFLSCFTPLPSTNQQFSVLLAYLPTTAFVWIHTLTATDPPPPSPFSSPPLLCSQYFPVYRWTDRLKCLPDAAWAGQGKRRQIRCLNSNKSHWCFAILHVKHTCWTKQIYIKNSFKLGWGKSWRRPGKQCNTTVWPWCCMNYSKVLTSIVQCWEKKSLGGCKRKEIMISPCMLL